VRYTTTLKGQTGKHHEVDQYIHESHRRMRAKPTSGTMACLPHPRSPLADTHRHPPPWRKVWKNTSTEAPRALTRGANSAAPWFGALRKKSEQDWSPGFGSVQWW